jgi:hypothetical protein
MNFWQLTLIIQLTRCSSSVSRGSVIVNLVPLGCFLHVLYGSRLASSPLISGPLAAGAAGRVGTPRGALEGVLLEGRALEGDDRLGLCGAAMTGRVVSTRANDVGTPTTAPSVRPILEEAVI